MGQRTSQQGIATLKMLESCKLTAYQCSAGRWTIGYGETGPNIVPGLVWTQQQADTALAAALIPRENKINELRLTLKQCEFDALVLFEYNTGGFQANIVRTLLDKIKAKDYVGIQLAFIEWRKERNPVTKQLVDSAGLLKRRMIESIMFMGVYTNYADTNPH